MVSCSLTVWGAHLLMCHGPLAVVDDRLNKYPNKNYRWYYNWLEFNRVLGLLSLIFKVFMFFRKINEFRFLTNNPEENNLWNFK